MMEKGKTTPAPEQEVPQEDAGRAEPEAMEELAGTGEEIGRASCRERV